ncbi:MAG TPA: methyltransferase domain-containing protein [Solirubrobacteraceae bacterium]|jgi:2-polyprenyl-3-methyl-5-hydroxy-6-metoxy-1,4-benzoquinol methylase
MATEAQLDQEKLQAFVERIVLDVGTAMRGGLLFIGDRLGIFAALAQSGPVTAAELSRRTDLDERYLREWLGAMATAEYLEHDKEGDTYFLAPEHALPLADEEFPFFTGGLLQMIVPTVTVAPRVAEAFKTGGGVTQDLYLPDMYESIERLTAPWYRHSLVQTWIPAMPGVAKKLQAGGSACDVGCGSGRAPVTIAKAFATAEVHGYDVHAGSIERARANAQAEGVADRVTFTVGDGAELPQGRFDLISTFDVVHDSVDPVGLMRAIRHALREDGTYLMLEMNASGDVEENRNPLGRMLYNVSTLYCMTTSLAHGGAGIGACMGEEKARELAYAAGFTRFRKLPIEEPFSVLYELKA